MRKTLLALTLAAVLTPAAGASAAAPANDNFASAEALTGATANATGSTIGATMEPDEPWHYPETPGGHSIWFRWTAPQTGGVEISTSGSSFDTVLSAYSGLSLSGIDSSRIQFSDDINPDGSTLGAMASEIQFRVTQGVTYRIAVDGATASSVGSVALEVSMIAPDPQEWDLFADAREFPAANYGMGLSNAFATQEPGEPSHGPLADGHSIWMKWTASESGGARFRACSDRRRHKVLAVYIGGSPATLTKISAAASPQNPTEECLDTTFMAYAGNVYRLVLDGAYGDWGWNRLWLHQDTTQPNTTLTAPSTSGPTAEISFASSEVKSTFQCRLDSGPWTACATPRGLTGLTHGPHLFRVRAVDEFGNVDASPAEDAWIADATGPGIAELAGPSSITAGEHATFTWTSEAGAAFECQLDDGAWAACSSPHTTGPIVTGDHTFRVRGKDKWGNLGQPAMWGFQSSGPAGTTGDPTLPPGTTPTGALFGVGLVARTTRKSHALRKKALTFRLTCPAPCSGSITVKLGRRVLGKARVARSSATARTIRVKLGRKAISRLRRARGRVRLRVTAIATDASGRRGTTSIRPMLR